MRRCGQGEGKGGIAGGLVGLTSLTLFLGDPRRALRALDHARFKGWKARCLASRVGGRAGYGRWEMGDGGWGMGDVRVSRRGWTWTGGVGRDDGLI